MAVLRRKRFSFLKERKTRRGFTLIEVMIVVTIVIIMILMGIWTYYQQMAKGRDARRKADLAVWQKLLEDYLNDNVCYPEGLVCGSTSGISPLEGYLTEIPCDPLNNINYNYMYTYETGAGCNKWYKIYAKLENESDPIIAQVDCQGGCGPSNNYNYWVGSANVTEVAQLPGEFWPVIPGVPASGVTTPTISPSGLPTTSPTPLPSPSPLPSPGGSSPPTTDPQNCYNVGEPVCLFDCRPGSPNFPACCGSCCSNNSYRCDKSLNRCILDPGCPSQ